VPGGFTYREAHLVMEMLHDSGVVGSLDVVELNPFLDHGGKTATLMVELVASLFGRSVMGEAAGPEEFVTVGLGRRSPPPDRSPSPRFGASSTRKRSTRQSKTPGIGPAF